MSRAAIAGLLLGLALVLTLSRPGAARGAELPSLSTTPPLNPAFAWSAHDYVVRCENGPVSLQANLPAGWQGRVARGPLQSKTFTVQRQMSAGEAVMVTFNPVAQPSARSHYRLRCLPTNFPHFGFQRFRPGGPDFVMLQMNRQYTAIYDRNGAPLWWYRARGSAINSQVLRDGTVSWFPANVSEGDLTGNAEIRRLNGKLVRNVKTVGNTTTDLHDLQLLANGNYLAVGQSIRSNVDTTAYGGAPDASIMGFEVQELTPAGKAVWRWNSLKYIGLAQTPQRWWDLVVTQPQPYDHQHWNSAELKGDTVLLSFRHLDAVYAINRKTGDVAWKLGGTPTPKSLTVLDDPLGSQPLWAQHDARRLPDGTVSVYDNGTSPPTSPIPSRPPRAVRYRIDRTAGTATLLEDIRDPAVPISPCCGSARRLPSGEWLIGWGRVPAPPDQPQAPRYAGAYAANGDPIFQLQVPGGFFYRAFPVPPKALTAQKLRAAMNAMARAR